jgi:hypothetical protein
MEGDKEGGKEGRREREREREKDTTGTNLFLNFASLFNTVRLSLSLSL